jgi:long-subunit acyl-CoA synthetase (AMP-forming)
MFKEMLDQGTGKLEFLVDFRADMSEDNVYALSDLLAEGSHLLDMGDRRYLDREIDPDVMGVLLFTSGTTGVAKGVMLSQKNLCAEIMLDPLLIKYTKEDIFFSVLPLHHTYECTCAFLVSVYRGSSIGYCQGLKYIQKDMAELKPTIFCGVPLIFESFRKSILKNVKKQGKERMFNFALRLNRAAGKLNLDLEGLLLSKVREVFGGRMRLIVMGGAPVKPELIDFYNDLGITAIQGYGLTECAPLVAAIPPDKKYFRKGSAGHILSQIEVEILNKNEEGIGEIAIKGPNVMMGYYNDPEATSKCLIDGWFHTGDLGYLDKEGYIYITGRSKNVIITKNGKNVYPEELENYLDESLFISESMVWADSDVDGEDSVIIATIRPDMEEVENYLGDDAKDPEAVRALIQSEVDRINEPQPLFKKIAKIVIKYDDFVKSTTHKIKRFEEENKGI